MTVFVVTAFQDLATGLKKALAGELEALLLDLLMPPVEYEAHRLQQAMAVSGCLCVCIHIVEDLMRVFLCVYAWISCADFTLPVCHILVYTECACLCVCRV